MRGTTSCGASHESWSLSWALRQWLATFLTMLIPPRHDQGHSHKPSKASRAVKWLMWRGQLEAALRRLLPPPSRVAPRLVVITTGRDDPTGLGAVPWQGMGILGRWPFALVLALLP
ncbi:hypothetical protein MTR67_007334 [Solanum verrucosum]|uniref:Uncharacterized protein n=1 Tax=Solanum verrucosum TaxID=315347 RepID=A0AAF0PZH8_SOLVR|nr:hypothetical protein MTR67_007334 [Solanum verrucosum]